MSICHLPEDILLIIAKQSGNIAFLIKTCNVINKILQPHLNKDTVMVDVIRALPSRKEMKKMKDNKKRKWKKFIIAYLEMFWVNKLAIKTAAECEHRILFDTILEFDYDAFDAND